MRVLLSFAVILSAAVALPVSISPAVDTDGVEKDPMPSAEVSEDYEIAGNFYDPLADETGDDFVLPPPGPIPPRETEIQPVTGDTPAPVKKMGCCPWWTAKNATETSTPRDDEPFPDDDEAECSCDTSSCDCCCLWNKKTNKTAAAEFKPKSAESRADFYWKLKNRLNEFRKGTAANRLIGKLNGRYRRALGFRTQVGQVLEYEKRSWANEQAMNVDKVYRLTRAPITFWKRILKPLAIFDTLQLRSLLERSYYRDEFERFVDAFTTHDSFLFKKLRRAFEEATTDAPTRLETLLIDAQMELNKWDEEILSWNAFVEKVAAGTTLLPKDPEPVPFYKKWSDGIKEFFRERQFDQIILYTTRAIKKAEFFEKMAAKYVMQDEAQSSPRSQVANAFAAHAKDLGEIWRSLLADLIFLQESDHIAYLADPEYRIEFLRIWKLYRSYDQEFRSNMEEGLRSIENGLLAGVNENDDNIKLLKIVWEGLAAKWRELKELILKEDVAELRGAAH